MRSSALQRWRPATALTLTSLLFALVGATGLFNIAVAHASSQPTVDGVARVSTNDREFIITGSGFPANETALGSLTFTSVGATANGQSVSDANGNITLTATVSAYETTPPCQSISVDVELATFDANKANTGIADATVQLPDSCTSSTPSSTPTNTTSSTPTQTPTGSTTPTPTGTQTGTTGSHKVTICHRTDSNENPYVVETVDTDSTGGGKDKGIGDHTGHTGPVWNPTLKSQHTQWGDIIPPYTDDQGVKYPGYNWSAEGQAIYDNGCKPVVETPSPSPTTTTGTPTPTQTPTNTPTGTTTPTGTPTGTPTQTVTPSPTGTPTTASPSPSKTPSKTPQPSKSPTVKPSPSKTPVVVPTNQPTYPQGHVHAGAQSLPQAHDGHTQLAVLINTAMVLLGALGLLLAYRRRGGAES